ncbi:pentapeptide repeat-containing protein [Pseudogemmobacter bohemicus]|uniref:pentapeptide repeat-containing protein n=1 Tax=Pseudogemmobacter bohemicus TaxID=2250708 RepID=UPI000DD44C44|nr:pentapeptide repeat-containing protein [Pseudogemmobacter bohemicus]
MTDAVTTLHIAPRHFWLIVFLTCLLALSLLTLAVLRQVGRKVQKTPWDHLSNAALTGWLILGFAWTGLLLLSIMAAYNLLWPWKETLPEASGSMPLGAGALVVALLGAPWVIWGTWLKHRTVAFQKEGHMTDRISKAVEQLGAEKTVKAGTGEDDKVTERTEPNIEVRIGGLLSLERIAEDSMRFDHGRDHIRVMQIICAYLRQNSRATNLEPTHPPFKSRTPRLDLQIATDVLCRRKPAQVEVEARQKYRLDLREVDFDGMLLSKGDFAGALMMGCRFEDTDLRNANLTATNMSGSLLSNVWLGEALLLGTNLNGTTMASDGFLGADLSDRVAVMISGAIMPSLVIELEEALAFFGSPATRLGEDNDGKMLRAALWTAWEAGKLGALLKKEGMYVPHPERVPHEHLTFLHWEPFISLDSGSPRLIRWRAYHNLTGWPHED